MTSTEPERGLRLRPLTPTLRLTSASGASEPNNESPAGGNLLADLDVRKHRLPCTDPVLHLATAEGAGDRRGLRDHVRVQPDRDRVRRVGARASGRCSAAVAVLGGRGR